MRSQEIPDVFLEKALVMASSQRPMFCCVLSRAYRVLVGDSVRSHDAFTALTLRAMRCHGVRTSLSWRLHCADCMTSKQANSENLCPPLNFCLRNKESSENVKFIRRVTLTRYILSTYVDSNNA